MQNFKPWVTELSTALRQLHKALVDAEADNFGPINGSFQLLNLVANHEHFAWLRELSGLMAAIDERRVNDEAVTADEAGEVRTNVETLIGGAGTSAQSSFGARYAVLLQQSPAVAMAHGDVRRALAGLPAPPAV